MIKLIVLVVMSVTVVSVSYALRNHPGYLGLATYFIGITFGYFVGYFDGEKRTELSDK